MKQWEANLPTWDFKLYARQCSWFGWKNDVQAKCIFSNSKEHRKMEKINVMKGEW